MVITRLVILKMQNEHSNVPSNVLTLLMKAMSQMRYW